MSILTIDPMTFCTAICGYHKGDGMFPLVKGGSASKQRRQELLRLLAAEKLPYMDPARCNGAVSDRRAELVQFGKTHGMVTPRPLSRGALGIMACFDLTIRPKGHTRGVKVGKWSALQVERASRVWQVDCRDGRQVVSIELADYRRLWLAAEDKPDSASALLKRVANYGHRCRRKPSQVALVVLPSLAINTLTDHEWLSDATINDRPIGWARQAFRLRTVPPERGNGSPNANAIVVDYPVIGWFTHEFDGHTRPYGNFYMGSSHWGRTV